MIVSPPHLVCVGLRLGPLEYLHLNRVTMADLDSFFARKDKKKVKGRKFTTTDEIARRLEETEKKLEQQQQQGVKAKVEPLVKKQPQLPEEESTTEEYPVAEDNPPKVNIYFPLFFIFVFVYPYILFGHSKFEYPDLQSSLIDIFERFVRMTLLQTLSKYIYSSHRFGMEDFIVPMIFT